MAISADIKLDIYNGALLRLAARKLASVSENRESRRVLDQYWGAQAKLVSYALERGDWNFALRSRELEPETAVEPQFGWTYAYEKPLDFRRLSSLSGDERFQSPLTYNGYADEGGYWLSDASPLYVRYVSDDTDFGFNSGVWTEGFIDYLEVRLAWLSCNRITNDTNLKMQLDGDMKKALQNAKSVDAMDEGVKFLPRGQWARSRSSRMGYNKDRSNSLP